MNLNLVMKLQNTPKPSHYHHHVFMGRSSLTTVVCLLLYETEKVDLFSLENISRMFLEKIQMFLLNLRQGFVLWSISDVFPLECMDSCCSTSSVTIRMRPHCVPGVLHVWLMAFTVALFSVKHVGDSFLSHL